MSNLHDDDDAEAADLDRAKILSRRAKLIAAALSGLSMTVSCGDSGGPEVCLSVGVGGSSTGGSPPTGGSGGEGGTGGPMACLSPQLGGGGNGGEPGGGGAGGSSG